MYKIRADIWEVMGFFLNNEIKFFLNGDLDAYEHNEFALDKSKSILNANQEIHIKL